MASPPGRIMRSLSGEGQAEDVIEFVKNAKLTHKLEVFRRASTLLQGDILLDEIPGITSDEINAVQKETQRKWSQPSMLYFVIAFCSLAAMEQGWAQTSMNGANLYFPQAFGIGTKSPTDSLIVGLINGGIYLSTGVLGAWLSGPINNRLGRRGAVYVGTIFCLIANAASAISQSWPQLLVFRFLLGVGLGINASTAGVYAAECAPALIRGGLAVCWQMFCACGIFLGFVANVAVYNYGDDIWRYQLAAPIIPTIPVLMMVYILPESPAWYIKRHGRYDLAFRSMRRIRNTELQAAKELFAIYLQLQLNETQVNAKPPFRTQIQELVTVPRIRRATVASYTVMLSQQLCGINIIAFYSSTIFSDAGFSDFGALIASSIFGFVNFIGALPAIWTMDTLGRRSLLLLTLPPMALTMFAAGLSFSIPPESPAHFVVLAALIYLFCAEYSPGTGPVPNTYSAEVFPLSHREIGMSMAVATANIWASILSLTFPRILTVLQPQGAFFLYAALNILAVTLIFLFVPETRQKTLEELDEVFAIPTRRFIKYQTREYLPWVFRQYFLRQKQDELQPLDIVGDYHQVTEGLLDDQDDRTPS